MNPLLIFSIDGIEQHWLKKWMAQGHLPNLAMMVNEGGYGNILGKEQYIEFGQNYRFLVVLPKRNTAIFTTEKLIVVLIN